MQHPRPPIRGMSFGGFGSGGAPPRDVLILLGVVFATYSLQFLGAAGAMELLRLTPLVWQLGLLWQLVTYPFIGTSGGGGPSLWILLELLILFWFSRDVYRRLGQKSFWMLLAWAVVGAALTAVAVELLWRLAGGGHAAPFWLMQGQRMLLTVAVAAFATLYRDATIYLFFVLPVQAKYFLPLEILFAFIAFLGSKDLAGFLGICAAVGITYSLLTRGSLRRGLRELWLRLQRRWLRAKLGRERNKRGFRVYDGEGSGSGRDPWVH